MAMDRDERGRGRWDRDYDRDRDGVSRRMWDDDEQRRWMEDRGYGGRDRGYRGDYDDDMRGYGRGGQQGYGGGTAYGGGRHGVAGPLMGDGRGYAGQRDERGGAMRRQGDYRRGDDDRGFMDKAGDEIASWFGDDEAERRREKDRGHRGRGPKNYRRSDDRIREDISDRLTDDPHIDASDIEVSVSDGEVTLDGHVASRRAKRHAEDLADEVSGVGHMQNNLRVRDDRSESGESGIGITRGAGAADAGTASG